MRSLTNEVYEGLLRRDTPFYSDVTGPLKKRLTVTFSI